MPHTGRARALVLLGLVVLPLLVSVPNVRAIQVGLQGPPNLATFDSDGDGRDDAAHITQVVATSMGTITATLEGHLFPPGANPNASWTGWVDAAFDTETVTCASAAGCNATFSLDLRAPADEASGTYIVVLNLTTIQTIAETIATGSLISGTFPAAIAADDGAILQYREAGEAVEADVAYRSNSGTSSVSGPKTRTWGGSAAGPETEQPTAGSPIRAVRMAWSPITADERIFVTQSDDGWLDAYVCTATCNVTNNIGQVWSTAPGTPERRFDVAYESLSGDAVLVYGVLSTDPTRDIAYRTYNGTWSAEQYLDDTGHATDVQYTLVVIASQSASDRIGLVAGDDTNNDVNAWIWYGTAFGSMSEITAAARSPNEQEADLAWESGSGSLVVVAAQAAPSTSIVSREFTTGWGAAATYQCVNTAPALWLSLKSNPAPTGNDMVLAASDSGSDLSTCYWDGVAWANWTVQDFAIDSASARPFDFAWSAADGTGLLVWGTSAGALAYRPFAAPFTWGAAASTSAGSSSHPWVRLRTNPLPSPAGTRILGGAMEATNDLGIFTWDGTALTVVGTNALTTDVGSTTYESLDIAYRAVSTDRLSLRYDWIGGAVNGGSATLRLRGHRGDEDVRVQVLAPPSTWTTRLTINSASSALYSYALTSPEYNAGSPSIRFVDASGAGGTLSDLWLDWVAVVPNGTQPAGTTRITEVRLEPGGSGLRPPPSPFDTGVALAIGAIIGVAAASTPLLFRRFRRRGTRDQERAGHPASPSWFAPVFAVWSRNRPKKIDVKAGKGYFAETFQRDAALQIVAPFVQRGYDTLVISRVHPDEIKRMLPFENAHPVWLIDYSEQISKKVDAVPPSLEKLFVRASTFMESTLRTAVIIDGLEFLIDNSNFSSVMRFLRRLIDIVAQRDCLLLVTAAPDALGAKERSNLERELTRIPL